MEELLNDQYQQQFVHDVPIKVFEQAVTSISDHDLEEFIIHEKGWGFCVYSTTEELKFVSRETIFLMKDEPLYVHFCFVAPVQDASGLFEEYHLRSQNTFLFQYQIDLHRTFVYRCPQGEMFQLLFLCVRIIGGFDYSFLMQFRDRKTRIIHHVHYLPIKAKRFATPREIQVLPRTNVEMTHVKLYDSSICGKRSLEEEQHEPITSIQNISSPCFCQTESFVNSVLPKPTTSVPWILSGCGETISVATIFRECDIVSRFKKKIAAVSPFENVSAVLGSFLLKRYAQFYRESLQKESIIDLISNPGKHKTIMWSDEQLQYDMFASISDALRQNIFDVLLTQFWEKYMTQFALTTVYFCSVLETSMLIYIFGEFLSKAEFETFVCKIVTMDETLLFSWKRSTEIACLFAISMNSELTQRVDLTLKTITTMIKNSNTQISKVYRYNLLKISKDHMNALYCKILREICTGTFLITNTGQPSKDLAIELQTMHQVFSFGIL